MDGVLLIDKPAGLTSHDVVAWARRRLRQRSIGHTGTLDPMATGLLVLVLGQATRLSSLLTGKDKTYAAEVRLGFGTDTDDAEGAPLGETAGLLPEAETVRQALGHFVGTFDQVPPAHSAKKVAGSPAYRLARTGRPVDLRPSRVTLRSIDWHGLDGDRVRFGLTVSAGFYVWALARDLGERLGSGGHLSALRRLASGSFQVGDAVSIDAVETGAADLAAGLIRPAEAIPEVPGVGLTEEGLRRIRHGNPVPSPAGTNHGLLEPPLFKVLEPGGGLVALARLDAGLLHPVAVLG